MTWIWLLVARVVQTCEMFVDSTRDVALEVASSDDEEAAELAEIIAASALALEEYAPSTDRELWAVTARDGKPRVVGGMRDAGLLVRTLGGQLGFTTGRGMVAMMVTGDLVMVRRPEVGLFEPVGFELPGFKYWKA